MLSNKTSNLSYTRRIGHALLALGMLAMGSSACLEDGTDPYDEFDDLAGGEVADENVGNTEQAWSTPDGNSYSFVLYNSKWGKSEFWNCSDKTTSYNCFNEGFGHNNKLSSFKICSNLSAANSFRVRFWDHNDYETLIYDEDFTIEPERCIVVNMPSAANNAMNSFEINP